MLRGLVKAVVLVAVLVGGATYLMGWWSADQKRDQLREAIGTTGVNADRARQVGAQVGERTAVAADQARRGLNNAGITAKIKAKMALDDSVKALDINVDTSGTTVTVSGNVDSAAQKERVLRLAKETEGVTEVVDRLRVK